MAVLVSHTRTWAESADLYFPNVASYTSVTSSLCVPSLEWSWDTAKLLGHILITHGPSLKLAVTLGGVAFMGQMNKDTGWWLHNRIPHTSSHPWTPPIPIVWTPVTILLLQLPEFHPFQNAASLDAHSVIFSDQLLSLSGRQRPAGSHILTLLPPTLAHYPWVPSWNLCFVLL